MIQYISICFSSCFCFCLGWGFDYFRGVNLLVKIKIYWLWRGQYLIEIGDIFYHDWSLTFLHPHPLFSIKKEKVDTPMLSQAYTHWLPPEELLRLCETWRIELLANLFNVFNLLIISAKNINMDVHGVLKASLCSLRLCVLDSAENFKIAGVLQVIEL